jgi:hypothetical protein
MLYTEERSAVRKGTSPKGACMNKVRPVVDKRSVPYDRNFRSIG